MMAAPVKSFLLGRLRLSPRQINKNKPRPGKAKPRFQLTRVAHSKEGLLHRTFTPSD